MFLQYHPALDEIAIVKFLAIHPSPLMYTRIFLRLEPLGLELVCETVRRRGHAAWRG